MNYRHLLTKYIAGVETTKEEDRALEVVAEDAKRLLNGNKFLIPPSEHEGKLWHLLGSYNQYLGDTKSRCLWTGAHWLVAVWQPPTQSWVRMGPWTPEEMAESHIYIGPTDPPLCKCTANDLMWGNHDADCPVTKEKAE